MTIPPTTAYPYCLHDWSDDQFLNYVEAHSATQRALFNSAQIARTLHLAGQHDNAAAWAATNHWRSVDMRDLAAEARNART